jgi:type IV pilus assembly protein PilV
LKQSPHFKVAAGRVAAAGFSLVEVLVALIIIGVGMLGIAKLQALAYASTGTSALRSLAALEASSLASAMHTNRNYWSVVSPNFQFTFAGNAITATTDNTLTGAVCSSACAAGPLAAYDVAQWLLAVNLLLPNVTGSVSCPTTTPVTCGIQLSWNESNSAVTAQAAGNVMALPTYTLYVVP